MPSVAILPAAVADQIAAGEVVERPASVVKELVENALDAGATVVDIVVEEGGRALVRVSDDGSGMGRDDAVLSLARHATSKIRAAHELVGVRSFGFRGEALPAICSVSHLEVETAPADGVGTSVRAAGGAVTDVRDIARRRGTTVSVARLFYNTPARQKFLRSARSEWRGISDAVVTVALTCRGVRFSLAHDGRTALSLPAASSLRARVAAIWNAPYAESLLQVDDVAGAVHVSGLVERPADVGTSARRVHLSVNGRAVRDAGLVRAAEAAYRSTIPAGVRPSLFLDVVLPADEVDVNVHPAKAEVRFRDRWATERAVERAVRQTLGTLESAAGAGGAGRPWFGGARDVTPASGDAGERPWASGAPSTLGALLAAPADRNGGGEALFAGPSLGTAAAGARTAAGGTDARVSTDDLVVPALTQLRRTYLMFEHDDALVLIDQHSAHERVLYERFMGALERGDAPGQRLLFPLTLHLGPAQADAFDANRAALEQLGFEVEGFGGHTLLVRSVPMPHARFDAERCLRDTLDALTGDRLSATHARHERLAATVACKAAIKAGDPLSPAEMRALFVDLARTTLPAHDVHGRSTIVQLSWEDVDRRFGRR